MVDLLTIAVSAAVSGMVAAIFGAVTRRDSENVRVRSELILKTHDADLRQLVEQAVQKARGEVERDLKSHEIRLRVQADIRLKLVDRMLTDVGQFRTKLGAAFNMIYLLTQEAEPRGVTPHFEELVEETRRAFAAVPTSAAYLPPELLEASAELLEQAHDCFRRVVTWAREPSREARTPMCLETNAQIEAIGVRARHLFGGWQQKQFSMLLDNANVPVAKLTDG